MADLPLLLFDMNETLLDLETAGPTFARVFGERSAMRLWFANLILISAAVAASGQQVGFEKLATSVMDMLGDMRGITINAPDRDELIQNFLTMPPHLEVPGAEAGEVTAAVQTAMLADLPYPRLRDAVFAHLTVAEGLGPLLAGIS